VFDTLRDGATIAVDGTVESFQPLATDITEGVETGFEGINGIILSTGPAAPLVALIVYGGIIVLVLESGRVGLRYLGLR